MLRNEAICPSNGSLEKEWIARVTSSSVTMMIHCCVFPMNGGMLESERGDGCFSLRASKVVPFMGASVSSEQANLTAPLQSLSSSFADTCAARVAVGLSVSGLHFLILGQFAADGWSRSFLNWLLIAVARGLVRHPLLSGCLRQLSQ